jgi:hypothetical protein
VTRWCVHCKGAYPDHEVQIVGVTETGSGPGLPTWACHGCVRDQGIVPPTAAAFIGRQDAPPYPAGEPA